MSRILIATVCVCLWFSCGRSFAADSSASAPPDYSIESSNASGKSLVTKKTMIRSVQGALEATFPDLATYFGNRPTIGSSYQDAKDQSKGGATFTADWNGHAVRGIVSCTIDAGDNTATIAVVFGRADAPRGDWDQLVNPTPPAQTTSASTQPVTASPPPDPATLLGPDATVYNFPDGTGSITLAKGWTTQSQSAMAPVQVKGPNDEGIGIGYTLTVNASNSQLIQMQQRNQAMMKQMSARTGYHPPPPPPGPPMLLAEFTDPVQAMTDLTPQLSKLSEARGGFAIKLDEIVSHTDLPAPVQGGKSAIIRNRVTRTLNGQSKDYDNAMRVDMVMVGTGMWTYTTTGINAPADRFDQEKSLMFAMLNSEKLNMAVIQQQMQQQNAQSMAMIKAQGDAISKQMQSSHDQFMKEQDQRFADGQAAHAQQMAGYAAHNEQWKQDELQKQRSNADFIETIKGTRTMYDTQTGQATSVDLNYIGGVVDSLNQATLDPNRFVQIPLRDEMYPVTGK